MRRRAFLACACCAPAPLAAQPARLMPFAPEELRAHAARFGPPVQAMFREDLVARLPPPWPARAAGVTLAMPAGEEGELPPLFFAAEPATRRIILPARSLLFLDEFCGLYAWLERRRCGEHWARRYAVMLHAAPADGRRPPGPLAAFGLDERIYQDAFVRNVSRRLLSTTVFFMLAHELGHVVLGHREARGLASQAQEREADAFAMQAMAAVREFPGGLAVFFAVAALLEGEQSTHPLSGSRVNAIAAQMRARPAAFVPLDAPDPRRDAQRTEAMAGELEIVGGVIDRPGHREMLLDWARRTDWAGLRAACPM